MKALIGYLGFQDEKWDIKFNPPNILNYTEKATVESLSLDNSLKMQSIGLDDSTIKRYLKEKEIITAKEFEQQENLKDELDDETDAI